MTGCRGDGGRSRGDVDRAAADEEPGEDERLLPVGVGACAGQRRVATHRVADETDT
jgi:hypothetical protein